MTIKDIQSLMNINLAGEQLTFKEMIPHLNYAIDEINAQLDALFPVLTIDDISGEYTAIPDRYIRSVVIPGAVVHFYTIDEEGNPQVPQFQIDYQKGIYYMVRDYSYAVPEEYQADASQGSVASTYADSQGLRGLEIDGNYFNL